MDEGSCCPICFVEYSFSGSHYPVALKCGHIMGFECIERWLGVYKKNYCPKCSVQCKKVHIRKIFAVKVLAYDNEKETQYMEKYIAANEEKKALESKIMKLESQIDIMKMSLRENTVTLLCNSPKIHSDFTKYCKIHFYPNNSLMEFDSINQMILITCVYQGSYGIYKYSLSDFSISSFIKFADKINDLKISPFNDGLCLICSGNRIDLMNIYSETVIFSILLDCKVSAAEFNKVSRDFIIIADESGCVHHYKLTDKTDFCVKIAEVSVTGICQNGLDLYFSTVFEIYNLKINSEKFERCERLNLSVTGVCTSIRSNNQTALFTFREYDLNIICVMYGEKFLIFSPEVKQKNRHFNRVFNGYIFLADDKRNSIKVLDYNTHQMVYSYPFKEEIVGFSGDSNNFIVLTKRGVYCYKSK